MSYITIGPYSRLEVNKCPPFGGLAHLYDFASDTALNPES